jgi:uncharacterized protein (TIGR04222 family)
MTTMLSTPMSTSPMLSSPSSPDPITVLAAEGDTWGIPGPTFVVVYTALIVGLLVAAMLARREIRAEPGRTPSTGWEADPNAVAFLNEGPALAVTAALSTLHVDGLIVAEGRSLRRVGAPGALTSRRTPLEQAVLAATSSAVTRPALGLDSGVQAALDRLRAGLVERGLLLDHDQIRRMRRWGWAMLAVLALGFARLCSGLAGDKAVGGLVLLLVVAGYATVRLLTRAPRLTAAADRELSRLRRDHWHLSPKLKPSWVANGAMAAGMGVALFGAGALWAADPAFADEIIARSAAASGGGSSSSCSSSGCGGGDSGGGSSCGGGGCGGGGCGG